MRRARAWLALLLALAAPDCAGAPPPDAAACTAKPLARLAVTFRYGVPVVAVAIDGGTAQMILDTGGEVTLLTDTAAARLRLRRDPTALPVISGIGGSMARWGARAGRVVLGGLVLDIPRMEVAPMAADGAAAAVDGALGREVLEKYNIDWNLPERRVTLYAASGCGAPPAGWAPAPVRVKLSHPVRDTFSDRPQPLLLPVAVDGRPMTALLDTGSGISSIGPDRAGTLEAAPPGGPGVRLLGIGPQAQTGTVRRFRSLAAGGEMLPGWVMAVGPVPDWTGGMVLAADFMRTRRAWLPAGGRLIWFAAPEAAAAPAP